jgi:hypothetical protein
MRFGNLTGATKKPGGWQANSPAGGDIVIIRQGFEQANRSLLQTSIEANESKRLTGSANRTVEKREPIVIVCRDGKDLECYSSEWLDLQFVNCPVGIDPIEAEQFIEDVLPVRHRRQFFPGMLRRRFQAEILTRREIAARVAKAKAIRDLRSEGDKYSDIELQRIVCGGVV